MTLMIPVWLLWVLGGLALLVLLALAALGVLFLRMEPWDWGGW